VRHRRTRRETAASDSRRSVCVASRRVVRIDLASGDGRRLACRCFPTWCGGHPRTFGSTTGLSETRTHLCVAPSGPSSVGGRGSRTGAGGEPYLSWCSTSTSTEHLNCCSRSRRIPLASRSGRRQADVAGARWLEGGPNEMGATFARPANRRFEVVQMQRVSETTHPGAGQPWLWTAPSARTRLLPSNRWRTGRVRGSHSPWTSKVLGSAGDGPQVRRMANKTAPNSHRRLKELLGHGAAKG
jgi:hypothetical protein